MLSPPAWGAHRFAYPAWCLSQLSDPCAIEEGESALVPSLPGQGFGVKIMGVPQLVQDCSGCLTAGPPLLADPLGHQVCPIFSWTVSTLMAVWSCPSSLEAEHPSLQDEDVSG